MKMKGKARRTSPRIIPLAGRITSDVKMNPSHRNLCRKPCRFAASNITPQGKRALAQQGSTEGPQKKRVDRKVEGSSFVIH
jgi:hypothetical protein